MSVEMARSARINFVHTFPRPPKMRGLIPVPAQKDWLEKWAQQVAAHHQAGHFVSASVGSTCFNPAIFKESGLDPEKYFARDEHNQPSSMLGGAYGKELMSSCYSNPHWIELLQENVLAFARAGFDGIWYDVGGYVDAAVLYCQCGHCRDRWRQHLAGLERDPAVPLPRRSTALDYTQWENREFLRWRWREWAEWSAKVRAAVQREYPRFAFAHNMGVREGNDRGMHMFLHTTTDVFDYVHWEEWGHGTAPYSDITSYLLGRAVGRGKPVMLVQNDKPLRNPLQHRIFLAEGYASGGVPQFGTRHHANSQSFLAFVERHEDLYRGGESMAEVAVVYSSWSQAIHGFPNKRWPAHWMGQLLLDRHVPFDYVIAERDLTPAALAGYTTLIVPDQACLTDTNVAAIRAFVARGGNLIATGQSARFDEELRPRTQSLVEIVTGKKGGEKARLTVGRSKVVSFAEGPEEAYWRQNPRDFAKSEKLAPPKPLAGADAGTLDWVLEGSLPLKVQASATTAALPRRQGNRILVHLVNYHVYPDGKELRPERGIQIAMTLPKGSVSKVEVVSPDFTERKEIKERTINRGVLRFTLDELKVYSVVVVELER